MVIYQIRAGWSYIISMETAKSNVMDVYYSNVDIRTGLDKDSWECEYYIWLIVGEPGTGNTIEHRITTTNQHGHNCHKSDKPDLGEIKLYPTSGIIRDIGLICRMYRWNGWANRSQHWWLDSTNFLGFWEAVRYDVVIKCFIAQTKIYSDPSKLLNRGISAILLKR